MLPLNSTEPRGSKAPAGRGEGGLVTSGVLFMRFRRMRTLLLWILLSVLATGCSTIGSRKAERADAYHALSPREQALVDKGMIDVGMDTNAVYIAWGKPYEIMLVDFPSEERTVWVYTGVAVEEVPYWEYRPSPDYRRGGAYDHRVTYVGRRRASGWVVFDKGRVASFESHPPNSAR